MAERLTEHKTTKGITKIVIKPYIEMSESWQLVADKLCAFEDILEKYGIESVEELKDALENKIEDISNPFLQGYVRAFFKDRLQYVEFERDTWKRACELACDVLRDINYKIYNEDRIDFENSFYQQAKKEGEKNETTGKKINIINFLVYF